MLTTPTTPETTPRTGGPRPRLRVALIVATAAVVVFAHYLTPTHSHELHDIYRRLLYIPVILGGIWFGLWGGLITALVVAVAYFPHVFVAWGGDVFGANLNRTLEMGMCVVVGLITGALSQSLRRERDRLARVAREREQALGALKRAHGELQTKTRQTFEAEEHLRRADRLSALGKLATGLAHEIRNPLGAIRGAAEILSDKVGPGDPEAEYLEILRREVTRLNGVLSNFLEFARGDAREAAAECSARAALEAVLDLLGHELGHAGVTVRREGELDDDRVNLPQDALTQVLLNLLLNARQAVPGGGVLEVRLAGDGDEVRVIVGDSGPGIPEERRSLIFEPFFTTREDGTGLGLSIVAKILRSHRATVDVGHSPLGGAQFTLHLPRSGE